MADALDLGSSPKGCRFNSCYPHQQTLFALLYFNCNIVLILNENKELNLQGSPGSLKIVRFLGCELLLSAPANFVCIIIRLFTNSIFFCSSNQCCTIIIALLKRYIFYGKHSLGA